MKSELTKNHIISLRNCAKKHGAILKLDPYGFALDCGSKMWKTSQDPIMYFERDCKNFSTAIAMMDFGTENPHNPVTETP
jgi:hypothetical protein